ncbi:unnamed protein product [Bursaphelenchus xylophilus]|uniref:(pine wood nematode) hypothetical protein n=1 Tax=Bursaphelenchus xylophilus TaxID=6326 RepID=A0A1I7RQ51_BURXY|nr:unnamed protein product [Bursaphelenchus xylophilus]CAG9097169.1 unnamed protein product [Bursaphelenchus xylophilus]
MLALISLLLLLPYTSAVCNVPPDFWCDNPRIALECTGSLNYCSNYVQNQKNRKMKIELSFEAACPDSRNFIQRIYPRLLAQSFIYEKVDFQPVPWGLSKYEEAGKLKCHHGIRECTGNRLLTCVMKHLKDDVEQRDKVLFCFMSKMEDKTSDPNLNMKQCFDKTYNNIFTSTILPCSNGPEATTSQKFDEMRTLQILRKPRFVPYIAINGNSHQHMQAAQIMLPEKVRSWTETLENFPVAPITLPNRCQTPPDYWCSTPEITSTCFDQAQCNNYYNSIYGRPVHFKFIYRQSDPAVKSYFINYVKKHFVNDNTLRTENNTGKVVIDLAPVPPALHECKATSCVDGAIQECIISRTNLIDRNNILLCLLENGPGVERAWNGFCKKLVTPTVAESIEKCSRSAEWYQYALRRATLQSVYKVDLRLRDYYVIVNGYNIGGVQGLNHNLHRLVCLWYRGPGHDRDNCYRCDIEPTHCI